MIKKCLKMKLKTKQLPQFSSKVFLAPMAGICDPAFRLLCKELGAGLVFTELTSVHAIVAKEKLLKQQKKKISDFIEFSEKERPLAIQLFGSDLKMLAKAVKIISPYADIIDYNLGCPSPHITQQMAGAALLQKPALTRKIFRALVENSSKPITLKMRAGVNKPDKFLKIAGIAEKEGIGMITLHPRTVRQGYSGKADWKLIKQLKDSVSVPIVGNGDVETPEDAERMLKETGCDYVMVGRAASRNPFIFQQANDYLKTGKYSEISFKEKLGYFFKYLGYTRDYKIKFANIRMQAMNFSKGGKGSKELRQNLCKAKNILALRKITRNYYNKLIR